MGVRVGVRVRNECEGEALLARLLRSVNCLQFNLAYPDDGECQTIIDNEGDCDCLQIESLFSAGGSQCCSRDEVAAAAAATEVTPSFDGTAQDHLSNK